MNLFLSMGAIPSLTKFVLRKEETLRLQRIFLGAVMIISGVRGSRALDPPLQMPS